MSGPELSFLFHESVIQITYLAGIILTIYLSKRIKIPYPVIFVMLFICSVLFFFFSGLATTLINSEIYVAFPHIDHTFGFLGIIIGIFISNISFRLPEKSIYVYTIMLFFLYTFTQFGCLTGYCPEIHNFSKVSPDFLNPQLITNFQASILAGFFEFKQDPSAYIRITAGIISLILILGIYPRLKNCRSIIILSILLVVLISFLNHFFLPGNISLTLLDNHAGLNIYQWMFLMASLFLILSVFITETQPIKKRPALQMRIPSDYGLFSIYFIPTLMILQFSYHLDSTDLLIFSTGFFISTAYLLFYFYSRIQKIILRFSTIGIILILGFLFVQIGFFENHKNSLGEGENENSIGNASDFKYSNQYFTTDSIPNELFMKMIINESRQDTLIKVTSDSYTHAIPINQLNNNIDLLYSNRNNAYGRKPRHSSLR